MRKKAIVYEIDFLSHYGLQNSMVPEFLKYFRVIVQKYVTKSFSIFISTLMYNLRNCAKIKRAKIIGKELEML